MTIETIELGYAVQMLPPGRVPFRRWRWELWHGPRLLAAGWRLQPLHAQRALCTHASRYAHRLHGVHPLRPDAARAPETDWRGRAVTVEAGELRVLLTPLLTQSSGLLQPAPG
jgi:hypothetical protein